MKDFAFASSSIRGGAASGLSGVALAWATIAGPTLANKCGGPPVGKAFTPVIRSRATIRLTCSSLMAGDEVESCIGSPYRVTSPFRRWRLVGGYFIVSRLHGCDGEGGGFVRPCMIDCFISRRRRLRGQRRLATSDSKRMIPHVFKGPAIVYVLVKRIPWSSCALS
jgi:hypothetical protein